MNTTTFKINKTNFFGNFGSTPNYSKILDSIIADNIKKCNPYLTDSYYKTDDEKFFSNLFKSSKPTTSTIILGGSLLKDDSSEFAKAANFLANYKKNIKTFKKIPFTLGKLYKLSNGSSIIFYDDEFQIGSDIYSYDDFNDITFINGLKSTTKDIIINIYTHGIKNIDICIK